MLHLEHLERPGEAWCGAEVLVVRDPVQSPGKKYGY
jgi:hypothetical protein